MRFIKQVLVLFGFLVFCVKPCYSWSISKNTPYTNYALNSARYYPQRQVMVNRYRRPNKYYIYTPQQARYNGFRTGAPGYNNMYYHNRYR